jgi:branched-chain amino acid transport system substrate-binding protein
LLKGLSTNAQARAQAAENRLRDAIETTKELAATHGVYNYSPTDHAGLDNRSRVLIKIVNGKWTLLP